MGDHNEPTIQTRDRLIAFGIGAFIAGAGLVAFLLMDKNPPSYLEIPLGAIGILSMPGLMLSLILSGSIHDPKMWLAVVMNLLIYWGIAHWIMARRSRKRGL